jgi:hypothetical protein
MPLKCKISVAMCPQNHWASTKSFAEEDTMETFDHPDLRITPNAKNN